MNISKTDFIKIVKDSNFDDFDVNYLVESIFNKEDEVDLKVVEKAVLKDAEDSLKLETSLEASGDISYIIGYLERYKEVVKELENLENAS